MRLHRSIIFIILSFVYFLFVGCSSGGDGATTATTSLDIAGVWTITETDKDAPSCNEVVLETFNLTVTQNGSSVTITDVDGNTFSGTLNGSTLTWSGSFPQDSPISGTAGITTLNSMSATIDASCNSLTGNASWTWTSTEGPAFTCSGTTVFTGARTPASGCGTTTTGSPTGVWEGTFTESGISNDVVGVVQCDQIRLISELTGDASVGTISVSGGSFSATRMTDYTIFGPPNGEFTSLTGTFTAGSVMSGTFDVTDGTSGDFSLTYDPVTDKGSSLTMTAGTWVGTNTLLQFTVDNVGAITGTNGTCSYGGAVSIIDAAVNIYDLSITVSTCPGLDGTYSGYAVISDTIGGTNNTLNIVVHNASLLVVDSFLK